MGNTRRLLIVLALYFGVFPNGFAQDSLAISWEGKEWYSDAIQLDEVYVLAPLRFENSEQRKQYYRLRIRVLKVFPYAQLARDRMKIIDTRLAQIRSKNKKREYTRRLKAYLEDELTAPLKKLSKNDGRVLIKLIDRQTGISAYDLLKEYRNGWTAFWYQRAASFYNMDLKESYNPYQREEDYWIEDILQRAFADGIFPYSESYKPVDLARMESIWLDPNR